MSNLKKHIVFLTPGFPLNTEDTTTIPALQIYLKSLQEVITNTKLSIIIFQYPFTNINYMWNGIAVFPLNGKNNRLKKYWIWHKAKQTLEQLHKKHPITTVHSFWIGECSKIGEHFSLKHNIKHLVTVMGQDAIKKNRYTKQLQNTNTKIITLSTNHKKALLKNTGLHSEIIPWFIDQDVPMQAQQKTVDILAVGALNKVKNYDDFIRVITEVKKTISHLNVVIIGEGNQRKHIEKQLKIWRLEKTVTLLGTTERSRVFNYMASAKVLLHTSKYESFGMVFSEALYVKTNIVSYNVGCAKSSKNWKIGLNCKELANACIHFLKNNTTPDATTSLVNKNDVLKSYISLYNA